MTLFNVLNYGAIGDGKTNDAKAIQMAINACNEAGGGRVLLPSGKTYYSGSIVLKSFVDFHIEIGACLKASGDLSDYLIPIDPVHRNEVQEYNGRPPHAFIYALSETNFTMSGEGTVNGNAPAFAGEANEYHIYGKGYPRPAMIFVEDCKHITFKDITLKDSHFWTLHPAGCYDVEISGVRILNNLMMANSDGIDPDHCKNVRISNCHIEAADDCIVLKNTQALENYGPTENVVVTGCTLISTSAAIKIGTEGVSDFRNIVVDSCIITRSNRGLTLQIRDGGNVENVSFSNIIIETRRFYDGWWGKAEPIYVTSIDRNSDTKAGKIKNIRFFNITCKGENGIYVCSMADNLIEELLFENVRVEIVKESKWHAGMYDIRPCEIEGLLEQDNVGVYLENAEDVMLRNVKVVWAENLPEAYGAALEARNVSDLKMEHFKGKAAHQNKRDILIQ